MTGQDIKAILMATLTPSIFGVIEAWIWLLASGSPFAHLGFTLALVFFVFAAGNVISFSGCLLLGIPAHLFLIWRQARRLPSYLLAGLLASLVVTGLSLLVPMAHSFLLVRPWLAIPDFIAGGPLAAGAFWYAIRPDRQGIPA